VEEETLEECKKRVNPPSITFVGDVSGSMQPNMHPLLNSILALIDMAGPGSSLRVILFDDCARTILPLTLLTKSNSQEIKDQMKNSVKNFNRSTNLELALKAILEDSENSNPKPLEESRLLTLFASDGLANQGRQSSKELLDYARSFVSYGKQTFHTLGIKTDPSAELNSELLKDLALDTCGSFFLTEHSDGIAQSIGDVLADHYFVKFIHVNVECISSNGARGILRTRISSRGATLRSDRALQLTWEFPIDALEPYTLTMTGTLGEEKIYKKETLNSVQAQEIQIEQILGCAIISPALEKTFTKEELSEKLSLLKLFAPSCPIDLEKHIKSLQRCLDHYDTAGEQSAEVSWQSYALSSGGGADVSLHANDLRQFAVQCSQEQYDSQQTVESESTKRFKTM
jgi:hypothetical protein